MGTSVSTVGGPGRKTGLDACKFITLRSDLPDGADTRYREEAFTKNKTKPTFCGHWWNVLASLPRHLTFKAQVSWSCLGHQVALPVLLRPYSLTPHRDSPLEEPGGPENKPSLLLKPYASSPAYGLSIQPQGFTENMSYL